MIYLIRKPWILSMPTGIPAFFLYLAYNVPHANNEAGSMFKDGMEVPEYGEFLDKGMAQS